MTFKAEVIEDSISLAGARITTLQLRYPRFIHAEFMTHREFSRNASSSRAIPVKRLIQDVLDDPAMPIHWGKNQPGMQARAELEGEALEDAIAQWKGAMQWAINAARNLDHTGAHKQVVNRVLEPFAHINVVVTATQWDNFFDLRLHKDAQPEIKRLAELMAVSMQMSVPDERGYHLPYVSQEEFNEHGPAVCQALSAARCARTSYLTHDRKPPEFGADLELAQSLRSSKHMSPFEHQARPSHAANGKFYNLRGWYSQRYEMQGGA